MARKNSGGSFIRKLSAFIVDKRRIFFLLYIFERVLEYT